MSKKIFIGVAWPYANGSLHLGHIAGCYLPADIFARYNRLKSNDVLMVSGSDEHGTPITITAEMEKTTPQAIVDRYNKEHTENMKQLGISFDLFTRTTTDNHKNVVQEIFKKLYEKEHIYKKNISAFYCENCNKFLPDRYLEGTCPNCQYEKARGDQCDGCGKLLDPSELESVRCKLCGGIPVKKTTDHLFIALSKFEPKLLNWLKDKDHWKPNVLKFTHNWLKNGLQDRAITRDIGWGIPVPIEGFEEKRIYVWFDAVIGYLAASIEWANLQGKPSQWEHWWKEKDARHYYFLAKDNIPFHSIIWPSILIGYDESLNLPYDIPANEYLCLSGEQFSKSRSVAIWLPDILKKFNPDAIRYYLSINMPENKDSNWLWNDFVAKNNDELVGTYGNFIHRVITFTQKNFSTIPKKGNLSDLDNEALNNIEKTFKEVGNSIERCRFKKGLRAAMNLAQFGNFYFDQNQPWKIVKNDPERCSTVLHICLKLVQALAVFTAPYLPFSSETIWKMLGHKEPIKNWDDAKSELIEGTQLEKPKPLFEKLILEDIVEKSDPFSKLDLRVAKIIEVKDHPEADKLYVMQIDLGPLGLRTIVAGMKPYYSKEDLTGKSIVVVTKEPVGVLEFDEFKQTKLIIGEKQEAQYNGKSLKTKEDIVVSDKEVKIGAEVK